MREVEGLDERPEIGATRQFYGEFGKDGRVRNGDAGVEGSNCMRGQGARGE